MGRAVPGLKNCETTRREATRDKRLQTADIVIDNDVPLEQLERRVREVWADLVRRAQQKTTLE